MIRNKRLLPCILSAGLLIFVLPSYSATTCNLKSKSDIDVIKSYIRCLDKVLDKTKQTQKIWIQKREFELTKIARDTSNNKILAPFTQSILDHEKYVSDSCKWRYLLKLPNALDAAIEYKQCEIKLIEQFTTALKKPI